jgi:sialate O-acetylesterase
MRIQLVNAIIVHCLIGLLTGGAVRADVRLPAIFSDHMVAQAGVVVPVWGWAEPGEAVTVSLAGQSRSVTTGPDGKWTVKLKPTHESQTLTVTGKNTLTVRDVLVGEVWLCAGQSNMAMPVSGAKDFDRERAAAALPQLRMFTVGSGRAATPQADCLGKWVVCTPETVGEFSATAYYVGREIHRRQGCAVGLVHSSRGGALIESWISEEAQRACPELRDFFAQREQRLAAFDHDAATAAYRQLLTKWEAAVQLAKAENRPLPTRPSDPISAHAGVNDVGGLFHGKIAPLIPFALRGVVWYQGESNATPEREPFYETQLRLLVTDWRRRWGTELPFVWVQLPNVKRTESWSMIREAQLQALDLPKSGMAVTIDIGEARNLHPTNKQDVGKRLAQWALGAVYGQKIAVSGPLPAGHDVRGGEIVLRFRHTDGGLVAKDGELRGFFIAGENRVWKPAQAQIEDDTVIVYSPQVKLPVAVRYAWSADPVCNLYNGAGLPASPFRTDDWKPLADNLKP